MEFTKMHGAGNDFIIINNIEEKKLLEMQYVDEDGNPIDDLDDEDINNKREFINHSYDLVEDKVKSLIMEVYNE